LLAGALLLVGAAYVSAQSGPAIALTVDASMVQQKDRADARSDWR